eukprot:3175041-Amphidinium_carterae.1
MGRGEPVRVTRRSVIERKRPISTLVVGCIYKYYRFLAIKMLYTILGAVEVREKTWEETHYIAQPLKNPLSSTSCMNSESGTAPQFPFKGGVAASGVVHLVCSPTYRVPRNMTFSLRFGAFCVQSGTKTQH